MQERVCTRRVTLCSLASQESCEYLTTTWLRVCGQCVKDVCQRQTKIHKGLLSKAPSIWKRMCCLCMGALSAWGRGRVEDGVRILSVTTYWSHRHACSEKATTEPHTESEALMWNLNSCCAHWTKTQKHAARRRLQPKRPHSLHPITPSVQKICLYSWGFFGNQDQFVVLVWEARWAVAAQELWHILSCDWQQRGSIRLP